MKATGQGLGSRSTWWSPPTWALKAEPEAGGPARGRRASHLAQPSHHLQTQARMGQTTTHRTPSLRLKSSWSGSPLRWKTAITPLWMLRGGGKRSVAPEAPRPLPSSLLPRSPSCSPRGTEGARSEAGRQSFRFEGRPGAQGPAAPSDPISPRASIPILSARPCAPSPSLPGAPGLSPGW